MRMLSKPPTDDEIARWNEFEEFCKQVPEDADKEARLKRIAKMCGCKYQTARLWHAVIQKDDPEEKEESKRKYYPPSGIVLAAFRANLELAKMKGEL